MPAPTITALPAAPLRSQSAATFTTTAESFVAALATLQSDINAFGSYLDGLGLNGDSWKGYVRVASTAAATLASDFENGDTIDGVVLATGDRVLIKDQAAPAENGIYTVAASGAPTRSTDADDGAEMTGASVYVLAGTVNAGKIWSCTTAGPITLGTTSLTFTQFSRGDVDAILGVSLADGDLGTFTGTTIADNQPVKPAIQALETAVETKADDAATTSALNARPTSATLAATGGAGLTGFEQKAIAQGTPLLRTMQDKGREIVTSADYTGSAARLTGFGVEVLDANTTGFGVTAVGYRAAKSNTTGDSITAFGDNALRLNTTGDFNTAFGSGALENNVAGHSNVAVGLNALNSLVASTGTNNVAVGYSAMVNNQAGNNNTAVGDVALGAIVGATSVNNVAIGSDSLSAAGEKYGNTACGTEALANCTTGLNNVGVGMHCGFNLAGGNSNVFMGYYAGAVATGSFNTFFGYASGIALTTGVSNIFIGSDDDSSGTGITTGSYNTVIGGNVTGLAAGLSNNIVIADGAGNIKARYTSATDNWDITGAYVVMTKLLLGSGLAVQTGANKRAGTATLVAGTVTVNNTSVGANDLLFIQRKTLGGTAGDLTYTLSASTSFTITSANGADTSTVSWLLVEGY